MLVSRAPLAEIERFRRRMGWDFTWASSNASDFNFDFHVSFTPELRVDGEVEYNYGRVKFPQEEAPGISFFYKDDAGDVFHTLLDLRPRRGGDDGHLRPAGHGARWAAARSTTLRHGMGAPPRPLRGRARAGLLLRLARLTRDEGTMTPWPWLAVAGVGALHGLNPATGWAFVAASGVRAGRRAPAWRALAPSPRGTPRRSP